MCVCVCVKHKYTFVKCFVPGISASNILLKEIESVNGNAPGRALALNKGLLGEIKYIYKIKILKDHYSINYLMNNKTK